MLLSQQVDKESLVVVINPDNQEKLSWSSITQARRTIF